MAKAKEHGANGYSDEEWEVYRRAKTTEDYSTVDRMRDEMFRPDVAIPTTSQPSADGS